jgi:hypothetical protein
MIFVGSLLSPAIWQTLWTNFVFLIISLTLPSILYGIYLFTRRQVVELASAGATIIFSIPGANYEEAQSLIDKVEAAKNRDLMNRPVPRPASRNRILEQLIQGS